MTTLVAITTKTRTVMAADGQLTLGSRKSYGAQKIIVKPPFAFAICGDFRAINIIENNLDIHMPREHYDMEPDFYIQGIFSHRIRNVFKEVGYSFVSENKEVMGAQILILYKGALYCMGSDFSMERIQDMTTAGSGGDFAIGALEILKNKKISLADKAFNAVEVASTHDLYTGGDITVFDSSETSLDVGEEYFEIGEQLYALVGGDDEVDIEFEE